MVISLAFANAKPWGSIDGLEGDWHSSGIDLVSEHVEHVPVVTGSLESTSSVVHTELKQTHPTPVIHHDDHATLIVDDHHDHDAVIVDDYDDHDAIVVEPIHHEVPIAHETVVSTHLEQTHPTPVIVHDHHDDVVVPVVSTAEVHVPVESKVVATHIEQTHVSPVVLHEHHDHVAPVVVVDHEPAAIIVDDHNDVLLH